MYLATKHLHVTLALISIAFFFFRFYWLKLKEKPANKVMKIAPHVIDTLLLLTAVKLMFLIQQFPLAQQWLTVKLVTVIGYIVFAALAMKAQTKMKSVQFLTLASICVILTVHMAITKAA